VAVFPIDLKAMRAILNGYRAKTSKSKCSLRFIQEKWIPPLWPERTMNHCHRRICRWNHDHVQATKHWFDRIVVGERLCPFAPPFLNSSAMRIVVSKAQDESQAVADIKLELNLLISAKLDEMADRSKINATEEQNRSVPMHETTLVVFDSPFVSDFREFVRLSWVLQSEAVLSSGHHNIVQLVLFHPNATHQTYVGDGESSAADYTIRSPYPTVHLLREVDVLRAVSGGYPNVEEIPSRNKKRFLDQGITVCQDRLRSCYERTCHVDALF
jgi:uncharacterized protein